MMRVFCLLVFLAASQFSFGQSDWRTTVVHNNPEDIRSSALLDYDADGDMDILEMTTHSVGNNTRTEISLREQTVDGIQPPIPVKVYHDEYDILETTDIDGDGLKDLVLGGTRLSWVKNYGGSLGELDHINAFAPILDFELLDLDNDGDDDIAYVTDDSDFASYTAFWQRNNDGEFGVEVSIHGPSGLNFFVHEVSSGDIDQDGDQDLVIMKTSSNPYESFVVYNDGNGFFDPAAYIAEIVNGQTSRVLVANVLGDDQLEIISCRTNRIRVDYRDGENWSSTHIDVELSLPHFSTWAKLDGNNDGYDDFICTADTAILWFEIDPSLSGINEFSSLDYPDTFVNSGSRVYVEDQLLDATEVEIYADGRLFVLEDSELQEIEIGQNPEIEFKEVLDYNGDGLLDIFGFGSDGGYIILNSENGFEEPFQVFQQSFIDARSMDIHGDGIIDFIGRVSSSQVIIVEQSAPGVFESISSIVPNVSTNGEANLEFGDFNGDGILDYTWSSSEGQSCRISYAETNLQFDTSYFIQNNNAWTCTPFDLNGDGIDDIGYGNTNMPEVWVRKGTDTTMAGTFFYWDDDDIFNAAGGRHVGAVDIDLDGTLDVVSTSSFGYGQGPLIRYDQVLDDWEFDSYIQTPGGSIIGTDLNNDGAADLCRLGSAQTTLSDGSYLNQVPSTIHGNQDYTCAITDFIDYNNDGWMDILCEDGVIYENNLGHGCLDPDACNYDATVLISLPELCCYNCGCNDPNATNYNESAECNDGTCKYEITGYVFYDENENGTWDETESPLPYQTVEISPFMAQAITNDEGFFFMQTLEGVYSLECQENPVFPFFTTPQVQEVNTSGELLEPVFFGLSDEQQVVDAMCIDLYPSGNAFLCNDDENYNICFRNLGTEIISGYVEFTYDELFQGYQEVTPIDSVVGNTIFMGFENLSPGEMYMYDVVLDTPSELSFGEFVDTHVTIRSTNAFGNILYISDQHLTQEVLCAYDPNDKQAFPHGIFEPHYIDPDTTIEFLVRFQNTGNFPANIVTITDTIDDNFDFDSFQLIANSHSVAVFKDPTERVISFVHNEINLPDSISDEPGSHGFVSFKLKPVSGLAPETVLHNTANIYFDNNPPIITNTTWHTIYECTNELANITALEAEICGQDYEGFFNEQDYVSEYEWYINDELVSQDSLFNAPIDIEGEVEVLHIARNALCEASQSISLTVLPNPEIEISGLENVCENQTIQISADTNDELSWELLPNDVTHEVTIVSDTSFVAFATNLEGCISSDTLFITTSQYPDILTSNDQYLCSSEQAQIVVQGAETVIWEEGTQNPILVVSPMETTTYNFTAYNNEDCAVNDAITVFVNEGPQTGFEGLTSVCPGDTLVLIGTGAETYVWNGDFEGPIYEEVITEDVSISIMGSSGECDGNTVFAIVEVQPAPNLTVEGNTTACIGEEITLTASGAQFFMWNNQVQGASYTMVVEENSIVDHYGLVGNCTQELEVEITLAPTPDATFTAEGWVLMATDGTSWQWYLNGEIIDGATEETYAVTEEGYYSVSATNEFGCESTSKEVFIFYVGVLDASAEQVLIYPNPSSDYLTIQSGSDGMIAKIELFDLNGKLVYHKSETLSVEVINVSELANGQYLLRFYGESEMIGEQVIIVTH